MPHSRAKPKQSRTRQRTTAAAAVRIAKEHLFRNIVFEVCDSRTAKACAYCTEPCWLVFPHAEKVSSVGGSRVIAISKKTGQVIFDGTVGE